MGTISMNSVNSKHVILRNYYSVLQVNKTETEVINVLLYKILASTVYGKK